MTNNKNQWCVELEARVFFVLIAINLVLTAILLTLLIYDNIKL